MKGLVSWFLDSRVAANLLAVVLVVVGIFAARSLVIRLFPEIDTYSVSVTVPYPGASPDEVADSIVLPIEEQLEGLEGVRKISSVSAENVGNVIIALYEDQDVQEKVNEIRTEISRITVFPEQAEEPQVTELEVDELIAQVVIAGDADPVTLKRLAEESRARLAQTDGISQARIAGVAPYLIEIEVAEPRLRALGLGLNDVSRLVASQSLELSGGEVEGAERRTRIRTLGKRETGDGFEEIVIATSADGTPVTLGDVATVEDGLSESPVLARLDGKPAVAVNVYRVGTERVFGIAERVRAEVDRLNETLPPTLTAAVWQDESTDLRDRIGLLQRNALIGLSLVLVILLLFLDLRVAFWVAVGVGISFVGAFIPMALWGISINQLSLFGFILAIGIVVDDAIVVGENVYATAEEAEDGADGKEIARRGTHRVVAPVIFSVSTTVAAFLPLVFLPGQFGNFLGTVAYVVIFVLVLSLIESFFILPKHLSHLSQGAPRRWSPRRLTDPLREKVATRLDGFSKKRLRPGIAFAVAHPLVVVAGMIGVLIASFGLLVGGFVKGGFFPEVEGNYVIAEVGLAESASEAQTIAAAEAIVAALGPAADRIARGEDVEPDAVVEGVFWSLGENVASANEQSSGPSGGAQASKAYVSAKIQDASVRRFSAKAFEGAWREAVGDLPGAKTLTFSSDVVGAGAAASFEVRGTDEEEAREATAALRRAVEGVRGVIAVRDDRFDTTEEVQISLLPAARSYGLSLQDVASQVRAAYFGAEAVRVQRDREEIEVRVRYTEQERANLAGLRSLRVFVPSTGAYVPLSAVAAFEVGDAPAAISRQNGRRTFVLEADLDATVATGSQVSSRVFSEIWPDLAPDYPGVIVAPGGDQEEQARVVPIMTRNFLLALVAIYTLLALAFRSYSQPLVVMSIIPFGLVGALIGHALFGYNLTLLSMFGVIGLSGVIINDALLMVDYANERQDRGEAPADAITGAAVSRFRPILLTTLTTFLGVAPLILERSVQAAFLVPTAISLGFGILFGTIILMLLVPAVASLHDRTRRRVKQLPEGLAWVWRHSIGALGGRARGARPS